MLHTLAARRGAITAPHHLAAQSGLAVLREGGNAIEAAVAAAATIAVVYPHMNGLGGDGFWLIGDAGRDPVAIDACGAAGAAVDARLFAGLDAVPFTGRLAACTVAGTVSGWEAALEVSAAWGGRMPLARLLEDAIHYADSGYPVTSQLSTAIERFAESPAGNPGFREAFADNGAPPPGAELRHPELARVLERLGEAGPDDFYRGDVARAIAAGFEKAGLALRLEDLENHRARRVEPLALEVAGATVWAMPPPTQGLAALMTLGMFERLGVAEAEGFDHVHGIVECTKQAYLVRDAHVADPAGMTVDAVSFLEAAALDERVARIDRARARAWPHPAAPSDTIWLGTVDREGRAVSFIQSLFQAFGSGVVVPGVGMVWHDRGAGFSLRPDHPNLVRPGRKPFHTLCPAMARFGDGRLMAFGSRGADGQPQTLAALFSRYAIFGQTLQQAVTAPRWRLGMGEASTLGIENRFPDAVVRALGDAGHAVRLTGPFADPMGHAGALVAHPSGLIEGAADPRSDGVVAAF